MIQSALTKVAVLGTDRTHYESVSKMLVDRTEAGQDEPEQRAAQFLATVAVESLWQQAGYRPGIMIEETPTPCIKLPTHPLRYAPAIACLKQMLMEGDEEEALALAEWCIYTGLSGQHAPEEYIPLLLDYGVWRDEIQDFLMLMMGDRARWLAQVLAQPEWRWALRTPLHNARTLAYQERWKESIIIEDLNRENQIPRNHPGLMQLATKYYALWSDELADAFLHFVQREVLPDIYLYGTIFARNHALIQAVARFPLHRTGELLSLVADWEGPYQQMSRLFEFRRTMLQAIHHSKIQATS